MNTVLNGRYRLEAEIGRGNMGVVYHAHDLLLNSPVALKLLNTAGLGEAHKARLLKEARAAARLNHPNIVSVHDAGEADGSPYIVMELVEGQTLRLQPPDSFVSALRIACQVCAALDHAHQAGIIHRDLKLENVVLTTTQTAKLMDFGLARRLDTTRLTEAGTLVGTPAYLAPELIQGQPASIQSDLYALGVILYELAAGRTPFEGVTLTALLAQHLHAPITPPSAHHPDIPGWFDQLVMRLLSKKPEERPASTREVLRILEQVPSSPPSTPEASTHPQNLRLALSLLGSFQACLEGGPITAFESNKVRALLAYLAVEPDRPHSRESLAALLWPDWPQQSALSNLRYALADLRKNLADRQADPSFLLISRESIQLNPQADLWVDVGEFEQGVREQRSAIRGHEPAPSNPQSAINNLQSIISLYRGEFLEGFSLSDSAPFEEWLLAKRETLSGQALKALSRLAEIFLEQGNYEQAEGVARRQIELEPWNEKAHQQLMRALSLNGERVLALAQYEHLRKALQRELKVEPSEETLRLYGQIRDGRPEARKEDMVKAETPVPPPLEKPRYNLPAPITSFIGREREIAQLAAWLPDHRLVTLTGSGGVGKTRLAIKTARQMQPDYPDGAWLVELAPLADAALVTHTVSRSLGLSPTSSDQVLLALQDFLETRRLLLILDNCEHVVEACSRLADRLLPACPQLFILATSREALGITGEAIFHLPPLTLPPYGATLVSPPFETLSQYEAIRLFVERAATTCAGFSLTPTNAQAIAQVCLRLEGIPLAIEMAAARTRMMQVEEIADRLADRFQLLTRGSRTGLPRHQTLRACIDWSYELLSPPERILLQRLSVFAGGWTLVAAEAVCSDSSTAPSPAASAAEAVCSDSSSGPSMPASAAEAASQGEGIQAGEALALLGQLVDKSLVTAVVESGGATRYHMLETIRQHAQEKLAEKGEAEAARDRHLGYYLALAEGVEGKLRKPGLELIQERLDAELDNLRLALEWSMHSEGNLESGLRLAAALMNFWSYQNRNAEGLAWLERLLSRELDSRGGALAPTSRLKIRARALQVAGFLAMVINELPKATAMAEESRDLFQELGPDGIWDYAYSLWILGWVETDLSRRKALAEECLRRSRATGDRFVEAEALMLMGAIAERHQDFEGAQAHYEASLAIRREIGDQDGEAFVYLAFGGIAIAQWDLEKARHWFEEGLALYTAIRHIWGMNMMSFNIGFLDWAEGKYEQAVCKFEQSLSINRSYGDSGGVFDGLSTLGELALSRGDFKKAFELFSELLTLSRKKENKLRIAAALEALGELDLEQGQTQQAASRFAEAQALYRETGGLRSQGYVIYLLGKAEIALGDRNAARAHLREALDKLWDTDVWYNTAAALEALACLADDAQQRERAVRLLGASQAWHAKSQYIRLPGERQEREARVAALRLALGEEAFAAAWAEGVGYQQPAPHQPHQDQESVGG